MYHAMDSIDLLEHGGGVFMLRSGGLLLPLADPREKHYQWVLTCLQMEHVPGTPGNIPDWKRALIFDRWRAAWDLPDFQNAQRLAYLVDNYRSAIVYDLNVYAHLDLGELWRARRWRTLLDILDHLPGHSWYSSTVSMDEKHAKMMAEAMIANQGDGGQESSSGPSLNSWTPEVSMLANVFDAVRGVQHAIIAVNSGGKPPPAPEPSPRPVTPLEKAMEAADRARRKTKHEGLVSRLLPHKG